jgi:hypothetical protein
MTTWKENQYNLINKAQLDYFVLVHKMFVFVPT